jgi:hypothetical protein
MEMAFETDGGRICVEKSDKVLTPYGGLAAFASFVKRLKVIDRLVETCPVDRTSPNASPVRDILVCFILTCVQEGKRFKHVRYVQHDEVIGKLFGVERRIPGDDAIRRFFERIDSEAGRAWLSEVSGFLHAAIRTPYILDWDSTVTTRYGDQEGVAIGYNPHKPGRGSHHPLLCTVAGSRLCLELDFRSGDSSSAAGFIGTMERLLRELPEKKRPFINRGDVSFASEELLAWHEGDSLRPRYLFKLRKTTRVREALSQIREEQWQGPASFGALQVCEARLCLMGWSRERRVVVGRRLLTKQSPAESGTLFGICAYEYSAWVTNISPATYDAFQIAEIYQQRADCENVFDELKNQWGLAGFCSQHSNVTELAARLTILSYNLWSIFIRFFNLGKHQEAKTSRKDFLLIASQLVESGRGRTLKMVAHSALWKRIEDGYLRLMAWLRATAPQLRLQGTLHNWGLAIFNTFKPPDIKLLPANCGI